MHCPSEREWGKMEVRKGERWRSQLFPLLFHPFEIFPCSELLWYRFFKGQQCPSQDRWCGVFLVLILTFYNLLTPLLKWIFSLWKMYLQILAISFFSRLSQAPPLPVSYSNLFLDCLHSRITPRLLQFKNCLCIGRSHDIHQSWHLFSPILAQFCFLLPISSFCEPDSEGWESLLLLCQSLVG